MVFNSIDALITSIKQDVGKIGNKIARGVANVAFLDLQTAHSEIMNSFYGGYTPVRSYRFLYYKDGELRMGYAHGYKRTGNLRSNSIVPTGVIPSGRHSFKAQIEVGSGSMDDYTNSSGRTFPASGVFDLMWNQGIRGLPQGYRGHVGDVSISASPVGVDISGKPDSAMHNFVENWGNVRGAQVAEEVASSI